MPSNYEYGRSKYIDAALTLAANFIVILGFLAVNFSLEKLSNLFLGSENVDKFATVLRWISNSNDLIIFLFFIVSSFRVVYRLWERS